MKILYSLLLLIAILSGCDTTSRPFPKISYEAAELIDITEPIKTHLDASILLPSTDNHWQGIKATVSTISEQETGATRTYLLSAENTMNSNPERRELHIKKYQTQIQSDLDSLTTVARHRQGHSQVFAAIAKQIDLLSKTTATVKKLFIVSDLMENDFLSFYAKNMLQSIESQPDSIQSILEKHYPIGSCAGIEIHLLWVASDYKSGKTYSIVSSFFKKVLESHGAIVSIDKPNKTIEQ